MARATHPTVHQLHHDDVTVEDHGEHIVIAVYGDGGRSVCDLYVAGETHRDRLDELRRIIDELSDRHRFLDTIATPGAEMSA